jgi:hypothetical protein
MRQAAFLLGAVVFFAGIAGAQSTAGSKPVADSAAVNGAPVSEGYSAPQLFATAANPPDAAAGTSSAAPSSSSDPAGNPSGAVADSAPAQDSQKQSSVQSVFPQNTWEAYVGYTFLHFNIANGYSKNTNGLNLAVEYYPHAGSWGLDAESIATFGSAENQLLRLWTGMGGGRYRFAAPRGLEIWGHGLIGGAKFVPQTPLGGQTGFAFDLGGGVDVGAFNHRLAFRFAGDLVATRFFGTEQYNPKLSAGVVFKY